MDNYFSCIRVNVLTNRGMLRKQRFVPCTHLSQRSFITQFYAFFRLPFFFVLFFTIYLPLMFRNGQTHIYYKIFKV